MKKEITYKIRQRKPDTTQDESSYSTSIEGKDGFPIVVGWGSTQGNADSDALIRFVKIFQI